MTETLNQDVAATTRSWRISYLEINVDNTIISIRFASNDGLERFRQVTGEQAAEAVRIINTRDNSAKSLQAWLLEQAQILWPEDFADGTLNLL